MPELGQLVETGLPVSLPSDLGWVSIETKCNDGVEKLFKVSLFILLSENLSHSQGWVPVNQAILHLIGQGRQHERWISQQEE